MRLVGLIASFGLVAASPDASFRALLGVTPEAMASRAKFAQASKLKEQTGGAEIPENFDSETNWPACAKVIGEIRDQSGCGCCWAFAAAEAASDRLCIATNGSMAVPISAKDVCFCASDVGLPTEGCDGGDITSPWEFIQKGAVTGGQYKGTGPFGAGFCSDWPFAHCHHHGPQGSDPYPQCHEKASPQCPRKCDASASEAHKDFDSDKIGFQGEIIQVSGADNIARAIMEGGPVETAITVSSDFFANYTGGIYKHTKGELLGGHAVRIVGFGIENGQKYWKVANSWNPYWGEKGYFRIARGTNELNIEDMVTASSPSAKWGKAKVTEIVV